MVHSFQSFMVRRLHSVVEKTYHTMRMGEVGEECCHKSVKSVDHSMSESVPSAYDQHGNETDFTQQVSPHSLVDMILKEEFQNMDKLQTSNVKSCHGHVACGECPSDIIESSDAYDVQQSSQSML